MICRSCQRLASLRSFVASGAPGARFLSSTARRDAPPATPTPPLSTPLTTAADAQQQQQGASAAPLSSCPAGTVLTGLNYFKNKTDPVAMPDDAYPAWLWRCLEVTKKAGSGDGAEETELDASAEFSKSRKQRRLLAKQQRRKLQELAAQVAAGGNSAEAAIAALAPKVPLQHQTINLPANETGTVEGAAVADRGREELRQALRRERRAKIKESNYLRSM